MQSYLLAPLSTLPRPARSTHLELGKSLLHPGDRTETSPARKGDCQEKGEEAPIAGWGCCSDKLSVQTSGAKNMLISQKAPRSSSSLSPAFGILSPPKHSCPDYLPKYRSHHSTLLPALQEGSPPHIKTTRTFSNMEDGDSFPLQSHRNVE